MYVAPFPPCIYTLHFKVSNKPPPLLYLPLHLYPISIWLVPLYLPAPLICPDLQFLLHAATKALGRRGPVGQTFVFSSGGCRHHSGQAEGIDENYQVITLILKKYGNLPLCLENYALFSLPPIFTTILYTYTLRNIVYLGEPSGNIITDYHGTFIHIFMLGYYPIYQKKCSKPSFFMIHTRKSVSKADTFLIHFQNFLTLIPFMNQ